VSRRRGAIVAAVTAAAGAIGAGVLLLGASDAHPPPAGPRLYVAAHGCKGGGSGSQAEPLCSIPRALERAEPHTRVELAPGRYPALTLRRPPQAGVRVEGGGKAVLASLQVAAGGGGVDFDGLTIPGGVVVEGGRDVTISGSRLSGPGDAVSLGPGTRQIGLDGNDVTAPHGDGIVFNSQSHRPGAPNAQAPVLGTIEGVTIRRNRIHDINVDAIRPANFARVLIEDNEIWGLQETGDHSDALQIVMGGRDITFRRNYVHDNTGQGFFIKDGLVDRATVEDNLFVRNRLTAPSPAGFKSAGFAIAVYETTDLILRHNTVWDGDLGVSVGWNVGRAQVTGNLFQDMVVDPGTGDPAAHPPIDQHDNLITGGWNWGAHGRDDVKTRPKFRGSGDYRLTDGAPYGAPDSVARR
jgi:Right handed beta helix region